MKNPHPNFLGSRTVSTPRSAEPSIFKPTTPSVLRGRFLVLFINRPRFSSWQDLPTSGLAPGNGGHGVIPEAPCQPMTFPCGSNEFPDSVAWHFDLLPMEKFCHTPPDPGILPNSVKIKPPIIKVKILIRRLNNCYIQTTSSLVPSFQRQGVELSEA